MQYMIPENPVLRWSDLLRRPVQVLPSPLDRPGVSFFGLARAALYVGLQLLGLRPGENILVPAFTCNAVTIPMQRLGVEARFYELDEKLGVVLSSAKSLIDQKTRALIAVNYFGFPQDLPKLQSFCRENDIYFIEDSANSFLSSADNRPLGTFGDISILSMRKTLPLPNGAALIVNNPTLKGNEGKIAPLPTTAPTNLLRFALRHGVRSFEKRIRIKLADPLKTLAGNQPVFDEVPLDPNNPPLSSLTRYLLQRVDVQKIKKERRLAFCYWRDELQSRLKNAEPVFTELRDGVVPYALPLLARDWRALHHEMYEMGVECMPWPRLPTGSPGWRRAARVVLVPLHQLPY